MEIVHLEEVPKMEPMVGVKGFEGGVHNTKPAMLKK